MRNFRSDLSPPTPKLHILSKEDYRNSIVDRFSMVFFAFFVTVNNSKIRIFINFFKRNFSKVDSRYTFNVYNGHQERGCPL